jgi:hypothetical protein
MKSWVMVCVLLCCGAVWAQAPALPAVNGAIDIMVQDAGEPARALTLHLVYPKGALANVTAGTGLMLDLHNWGGVTFHGAPNPNTLANAYDMIAIGVQYYQSGDSDRPTEPPYDFGYRQAMDALRGLQCVYQQLLDTKHPFDATRIYGCGGSGGGNVIQMANKFAPHTFACIVDLSGMASLTDDIAYREPGGSVLNARYSRDPASPAYLTRGMQEIRDLGNPAHLALMARTKNRCRIVMIHGEDDAYCLSADKRRVAEAMVAAGLSAEAHILTNDDADGTLILNSGHSLGDRTALLQHFAGKYLSPDSPTMCRLTKPCDFAQRKAIRYPVSDGVYTVTYAGGMPKVAFSKR